MIPPLLWKDDMLMLYLALLIIFPLTYLPGPSPKAEIDAHLASPTATPTPGPTPVPCDCGRLRIDEPLELDKKTIGFNLIGSTPGQGYRWTVSTGTIVRGQGTREIQVRMRQAISYVIKVTVEPIPTGPNCKCPKVEQLFRELRPTTSFLRGGIKGSVLSDRSKPVADALVELLYDDEIRAKTQTDSNGRFVFEQIAADDKYTLRVSSGDLGASRTVLTKANKTVTVAPIKLKTL